MGRRTGPNGEIWPDDKTLMCATCDYPRGRHWFGLYTGYCPDEAHPGGKWQKGQPVLTYAPKDPTA